MNREQKIAVLAAAADVCPDPERKAKYLARKHVLILAATQEERELENALQKVKNFQDMGAILIRYAKEKEKKGEKLSNEKLGQIYDKIVNQKIKVSNENADILNSPKRKEYEKFKKDFNEYLKLRNRAREASRNKDLKRELELLEQSMQNKDKLKRKEQDVEKYYRQLKKRENQLKQERELEDKRLAEFYRRSEDDKPDISSFKEKIAKIDKELLENRKEQQKHEPEYNAIQNKKRKERLAHSKGDDKGNGDNGSHPGCNQYEHKPGCPRDKD